MACHGVETNDPHYRGILVLGQDARADDLRTSFGVAARHEVMKGFAVGRTIFADVARAWMAGSMTGDMTAARMSESFTGLCEAWGEARAA